MEKAIDGPQALQFLTRTDAAILPSRDVSIPVRRETNLHRTIRYHALSSQVKMAALQHDAELSKQLAPACETAGQERESLRNQTKSTKHRTINRVYCRDC